MNAPDTVPDINALRAAAEAGDPEAGFRLGLALAQAGDLAAATAAHERAAQAGHPVAALEYARLRLYGMVGVPAPETAVRWLLRAEQAGLPMASDLLVQAALGGVVLPRDGRINERVMRGVQADFPPALLAAALHFGRKAHPEDQALCLQLLERGAARGDAIAAALMAERLAHGEGCEAQPDVAADLWTQLDANGFECLPAFTLPPPDHAPGPPRQLALEEVLRAPSVQVLHASPRIGVVPQLLSADECRLLIAASRPHLHASQTADPVTGIPLTLQVRTSHEASLDPLLETTALRMVQLRMAAAAGIDLPHGEQLTVLRYAPGQQYRPHRDYLPPGTLAMDRPHAGNRQRTVCVYLNPVAAGGATDFPTAGVRVTPEPGKAVVFDSLHADGTPDPDSLHAGLPVEHGEKWLATLWIRQGRYRMW